MPRPHILLTNTGLPPPSTVLDPRYHPLGQPGPRARGAFFAKIPSGFRLPALITTYCLVTWSVRHWMFPHGARTVHNVRLPMYTDREVKGEWYERLCKQTDIFRWGHVYAAMQERRIREAKKDGILPSNYPENEEQLSRMDPEEFEAMMPEVTKIRFDVGVDRMDGVCCIREPLPADHGLLKE